MKVKSLKLAVFALFASGSLFAEGLNGHWNGVGVQSDGSAWEMDLFVNDSNFMIEYPTLKCGGRWLPLELSERSLLLKEKILHGKSNCIDDGIVKVELVGDTLLFSWHYEDMRIGATSKLTKRAQGDAEQKTIQPKKWVEIYANLEQYKSMVLEVGFPVASAELNQESKSLLIEVCAALSKRKGQNNSIVILGYTDASGSIAFNAALSKRRADAVKSFIISKARFDSSRIRSLGMGINSEQTPPSKDPGSRKAVIQIN